MHETNAWVLDPELQLRLLKLDILASLARSERALARIAECFAEASGLTASMAKGMASKTRLEAHAEAIGAYERHLAERIEALLPAPRALHRSRHPAAPWLHPRLRR